MTGERTWEWTSPAGDRIVARLDATGVESIYVGPRLVSRAHVGTRPDGHVIPPRAEPENYRQGAPPLLVVSYDPVDDGFVLRANGQVVPPSSMPSRSLAPPRPSTFAPPPRSGVSGGTIALLVLAAIVGGAILVQRYGMGYLQPEPPAGQQEASTRLLVLHWPAGFKPQKEITNAEAQKRDDPSSASPYKVATSTLSAGHYRRDEGVFAASIAAHGRADRDPWVLSNALHAYFEKVIREKLSKEQVAMNETAREMATCGGESGAAVTADFSDARNKGVLWTCTFIHNGDAFLIGYYVNDRVKEDAPKLRAILDQIELTP